MHTIRISLSCFLLCLLPLVAKGQQHAKADQPNITEVAIQESNVWDDILNELKEIKTIQDSTYQQRMRAIEARKAGEKDHESSEFGVMSEVERNTRFNFFENDFNAMGIVAIIVAFLSLWVAYITYKEQKQTELNTMKAALHTQNAPLSVQKSKLTDLARHFYRNLVCTCAAIFKYKDKSNLLPSGHKMYPSESNLLKLQVLPDDIVMPIEIAEKSYKEMHELRLLFRNYNVEVNVASMHLSRRNISEESLVQDIDNLLYKPIALSVNTFKYERALYEKGLHGQSSRNIVAMLNEHFTKLMKPGNFGILLIPENIGFVKELLKDDCGYIQKFLDIKDGIGRSLRALLEAGYKDNPDGDTSQETVIFNEVETDAKKSYFATVNRNKYLSGIEDEELKTFVRDLLSLSDSLMMQYEKKELIAEEPNENHLTYSEFFKRYYAGRIEDKRATVSTRTVFLSLEPYFRFLKQNEWDSEMLIRHILAVDIAIETDRIGMVNYE